MLLKYAMSGITHEDTKGLVDINHIQKKKWPLVASMSILMQK